MTIPETRRTMTIPPDEISRELMPIVEALGLVENCRQLASEGYTIIENAADPEFVARLRNTILASTAVCADAHLLSLPLRNSHLH